MSEQTLHFLAPSIEEAAAPYTRTDAKRDITKWRVANTAYHNGAAIMPDAMFDKLTRKLAPFFPEVNDAGAAPKAQAPSARKVRLEVPMNSLDKVFAGRDELTRAIKRYIGGSMESIVAEKVDGYSLQLRCDKNGQRKLYTRGNSKTGIGQDVSHLLPHFDKHGTLGRIAAGETIRFELVIPRGSSKTLDKDSALKRNAVASIVNSKVPDAKIIARSWAIALTYMEPALAPSRGYKKLKQMGWRIPRWQSVKPALLTEKYLTSLATLWVERARYECDGLVVFANVAEKPSMTNPKHAFAYKVDDAGLQTTVRAVRWQVSRYGRMTPVCDIDTVNIDGVKVNKATAHNAAFVKTHKLGPGAVVEVIRSGGVIPKIIGVVSGSAKASFPKAGTYEWDENKTHISTLHEDHTSDANARQHVEFFGTRGLNVNGFGPSVAALVANRTIHQVINMTSLDWTRAGGGPAVAREMPGKIKAALQQAKVQTIMSKSGVFGSGFGDSSSRDLVEVMQGPNKPTTKGALANELESLVGWSGESAADVAGRWKSWVKWFNALPYKPSAKAAKAAVKTGPLVGAVIVFTQVRDAKLQADIEKSGGTIGAAVTKATTHVIYADGETSVKRTKAEQNKIPTIPYSKARAKLKL